MEKCDICYDEIEKKVHLPCSHYLCNICYEKISNTCPFCRHPLIDKIKEEKKIEIMDNDPDYWLEFDNREWITYSRFLRNGNEVIRSFRTSDVPDDWRNNDMTTIVKRKRQRKQRRRRYN